MNLPADHAPTYFQRRGHWAVACVLVLAFVTGGSASAHMLGNAITQWLALPLLAWAVLALASSTSTSESASSNSGWRRAAVLVALLVVVTVAVQQLPLGQSFQGGPAVRQALAADLQLAGVSEPHLRWSLSPLASESALWSLLPALAVFLGALALPPTRHRCLLLWVVGLSAASLLLGYLQLGAPQDSLLNPFPQWAPALNGFFANPNHQSTGLVLALVAITALLLYDRGHAESSLPRWGRFSLVALALLMLASLPLTGSRAAFLLAVLGLVAVPLLLLRGGRRSSGRSTPRTWIIRGLLGALALGAVIAAIGWLRFDLAEEVRGSVAIATARMGVDHAPWGAGVGSFVPWFEQAAPAALVQSEYFNHAHNEYAQWWLESGALGLLSLLAVAGLLIACFPRRSLALPDRGVAVAAWLGCVLVLLHSLVDYPLRTPALMTVTALLAGIAVAQRSSATPKRETSVGAT